MHVVAPSRCSRLHVAVLNIYCVNAISAEWLCSKSTDKAVKGCVSDVSSLAVQPVQCSLHTKCATLFLYSKYGHVYRQPASV
jgi:hypothetical protein